MEPPARRLTIAWSPPGPLTCHGVKPLASACPWCEAAGLAASDRSAQAGLDPPHSKSQGPSLGDGWGPAQGNTHYRL